MGRFHVCSLAKVPEIVRATGARSLVTLIDAGHACRRGLRKSPPSGIFSSRCPTSSSRSTAMSCPPTPMSPRLLDFVERWDRTAPMLIHCYAGVSRSTAAAFIAACALSPHRDEHEIAAEIRRNSPTATPNARLVALGDEILQRGGRMNAAIAKIGRGADCFEGTPFALELH